MGRNSSVALPKDRERLCCTTKRIRSANRGKPLLRLQSTESTRALSSSLKVVSSKYSRVEPRITARREPAMTKAQLVHRQPSQRQQRDNRPTRSVSFVYRPSRLVPPDLGRLLLGRDGGGGGGGGGPAFKTILFYDSFNVNQSSLFVGPVRIRGLVLLRIRTSFVYRIIDHLALVLCKITGTRAVV